MRKIIYEKLNSLYGILMTVSFFGGFLPIIPFIIAIIIGGPIAESICVFLYKKYYLWIIALASFAILIGWVAMYIQPKDKKI